MIGVGEAMGRAGRMAQQQTLLAINKLDDADTSELMSGAYSVVHVWKALPNAIRAKTLVGRAAAGGVGR